MAKSNRRSENLKNIETVESWFSDAQELAVGLLMLRQWRWSCRKVSVVQQDASPKQRRELTKRLNSEADARVDLAEEQIELLRAKSQSLENRFSQVWPGLKLSYCELGDFEYEGLPSGRCAWVVLQSLTERVLDWGRYLANEQQKRTLNAGESVEFQKREGWLSGAVDAIRARLLKEESRLLRDLPNRQAVASNSKPENKTGCGGRRPKYSEEKKSQFQSWWGDYKESLEGKRPSLEDFLEWGNENKGVDFPTEISEIESLKRAIRYDKNKIQRQN